MTLQNQSKGKFKGNLRTQFTVNLNIMMSIYTQTRFHQRDGK